MKKPIITKSQRDNLNNIEFEIVKLKFKKAFENSSLGQLFIRMIKRLSKNNGLNNDSLAVRLAIVTPYTVDQCQAVIDFVTYFYGEDEQSETIINISIDTIKYAMENKVSFHEALYIIISNEFNKRIYSNK